MCGLGRLFKPKPCPPATPTATTTAPPPPQTAAPPALPLSGKTALITGASRGIGASIAATLHAQGATVVINYSRAAAAPASALAAHLGTARTHHIQADVSSAAESQRLVAETVARCGRIDILVLNAGVLPGRDLAATTEADFDGAFAANVKGPYFVAQAAAPHIPAGGRVVFFSTSLTAATTVAPDHLLCVATRGAVEQMTRVLAKDLGRRGICVNCVSPGPTGTDLSHDGKPQEVAAVVGFLAGHESAWVNGQNMGVNGGMA